jgi:metalloendopeptidase OMA1, mitochondrial
MIASPPGRTAWISFAWWTCFLASALACSGPATQEQPRGQGPGGRAQPLALSPRQEFAVGIRAYNEVIDRYHGQLEQAGSPDVQRARGITMRIARAVEIEPLQREINLRLRGYRFAWEANVIRDRQVNAFCLPGGKVFVFTGILPVAENDDQLATVLSHEIAHALAHHSSERLAREQQSGGGILGSLGKLRFDRQQEAEADHIGVFLMTFAGYDPRQAIVFWQRMARQMADAQRPPEWMSDHPSDEHRIAQIRQEVPKAIAGKKAYDAGAIAPPP